MYVILLIIVNFIFPAVSVGDCPDDEVQVGITYAIVVDSVAVPNPRLSSKQIYCINPPCYYVESCSIFGNQEPQVIVNNETALIERSPECACEGNQTCNGNQYYCESVATCDTNAACYCNAYLANNLEQVYYQSEWREYEIVAVPICQPPNLLPLDPYTLLPINIDKRKRQLNYGAAASDTTELLWRQPNIKLKLSHVTVHLGCDELVQTHICGTVCEFDVMPGLLRWDKLCIKIENSTGFKLETSVAVVPEVWCMMPDCVFCSRFQEAFTCFPDSQRLGIVLGAVGVALSALIIIVQCLFWLAERLPRNSLNINIKDAAALAAIACIMMAGPAHAATCTGGLLLDSRDTICFMDGTDQHCNISLTAVNTLRYPGDTLCVAVNDDGGSLLGELRLTYVKAALDVSLVLQYWTSNWQLISTSIQRCRSGSQCNNAKNCQTPITNPSAGGAIPSGPNVLTKPGVTTCQDLCGCAGCACINCAAACGYSRWGIAPIPNTFPIFSPSITNVITDVQAEWIPVEGPTIITQFALVGAPVTVGPFTVALEGVFNAPDVDFADWKVMGCGLNCMKFVKASQQNIPIKGTIGDVQGASSLSFTNPSPTSFLFDTSICTGYPQGRAIGFTCSVAGAAQASGYQTFTNLIPIDILGLQCRVGALQNLECDIPAAPPILTSFVTSQNLTLVREVTIICPVGDFVAFSGCYGCDQGANMTLRLKSVCLPGTESVSIDFGLMVDNTVDLTLQDEVYNLRFTTTLREIDGTITIGSADPDRVLRIRVTGTLLDPISYIQQLQNQQSVNGTSFSDWFNRLDWSERTGTLIGIIIGSIFGIVALVVVAWLVVVLIQRSQTGYGLI